MKYLLDTTWAVEYFRGNEHLARRVQDLAEDGLAVSMISVAELYEGVFRSDDPPNNEQVLRDFLRAVTVLDVSEATARAYGELRASLVRAGTVLGALDLLIAATALHHDLTLLTLDRDFQRVNGLQVISS